LSQVAFLLAFNKSFPGALTTDHFVLLVHQQVFPCRFQATKMVDTKNVKLFKLSLHPLNPPRKTGFYLDSSNHNADYPNAGLFQKNNRVEHLPQLTSHLIHRA